MRARSIHPVFIAIHPALATTVGAGRWTPLEEYVRPAAAMLALACAVWLLLARTLRSSARAALAVSTAIFVLFSYADAGAWLRLLPAPLDRLLLILSFGFAAALLVRGVISGRLVAAVAGIAFGVLVLLVLTPFGTRVQTAGGWLVLTGLLVAVVVRCEPQNSHVKLLNLAALGLILLPAYAISARLIELAWLQRTLARSPTTGRTSSELIPLKATNSRDVFILILDGYGGANALQRYFAFDNTPFVRALRERGFFVANRSRANYSQTEQSIACLLSLDYLDAVMPSEAAASSNRSLFKKVIDSSEVEVAFVRRGYEYIPISSGFFGFNQESERSTLSDPPGLSLSERLILGRTPEAGLLLTSESAHESHRQRITNAFAYLEDAARIKSPKLVVTHILSPHPPFVFDRVGRPKTPNRAFGLWDCQAFVEREGSRNEYIADYPEQLRFLNVRVLQAIDTVRAASEESIILVVGDHGSRMGHSMHDVAATNCDEAYSNLLAVLGPRELRSRLYDDITPVNAMRAIVGLALGTDVPRIGDRSYYSSWTQPYVYEDVTDRVESDANRSGRQRFGQAFR